MPRREFRSSNSSSTTGKTLNNPMKLISEIVTMTPAQAAELLSTINTHNRNLSKAKVTKLTHVIVNGDWLLTHQGIAIDSNGVLLDGQHRLAAIVRSKKTVEILVSKNCDPASFPVIDTGSRRSAADAVFIAGTTKNSKQIAAALKVYHHYLHHPDKAWTGHIQSHISHPEILRLHKQRGDELDYYSDVVRKGWHKFKPIHPSSATALALITADENWSKDDFLEFLTQLTTGCGLTEDNPILSYRNFIANNYVSKDKGRGFNSQAALASMIVIWNDWKTETPRKRFRPSAANYPPVCVMPKLVNKVDLGLAPNVLKLVKGN